MGNLFTGRVLSKKLLSEGKKYIVDGARKNQPSGVYATVCDILV